MGEDKNHKNSIEYFRQELENINGFRCRREYDVVREGNFHKLDLVCFKQDMQVPVAMEVETDINFSKPQIISNKMDLLEFKKLYPKAKILHVHISQPVDFQKELSEDSTECKKDNNGNCVKEIADVKAKNTPKKNNVPKGWIGPINLKNN